MRISLMTHRRGKVRLPGAGCRGLRARTASPSPRRRSSPSAQGCGQRGWRAQSRPPRCTYRINHQGGSEVEAATHDNPDENLGRDIAIEKKHTMLGTHEWQSSPRNGCSSTAWSADSTTAAQCCVRIAVAALATGMRNGLE